MAALSRGCKRRIVCHCLCCRHLVNENVFLLSSHSAGVVNVDSAEYSAIKFAANITSGLNVSITARNINITEKFNLFNQGRILIFGNV